MKIQETTTNPIRINAENWFESGFRIPYDISCKEIVAEDDRAETLKIWNKVTIDNHVPDAVWITMMPGFPDGSFGWAATENYLAGRIKLPRLYVEYVGMGDSDKPLNYEYGVRERADMIEALWKHHKIRQTDLVTFDFSSLVALELLSRQISRKGIGLEPYTSIQRVLFINGGLFADSHSHPILTTPLLKTIVGKMGAKMAQNSTVAFNMMMKGLWSKEYGITKEELAENHKAIGRREGTLFMSNAAGFVDEHKKNARRWDFKRIFTATFPDVKYIVAGSEKDQFEYKQVQKARRELQPLGLEVEMYPGGHMTTSEYPDLIAITIEKLKLI